MTACGDTYQDPAAPGAMPADVARHLKKNLKNTTNKQKQIIATACQGPCALMLQGLAILH
jgi:hypothetical protein